MKKFSKIKNAVLMLSLAFAFILLVITSAVYAGGDQTYKSKPKLQKSASEYFVFDINNMNIPIDNKGIIADVSTPGRAAGGTLDNIVFLFSGGFYFSGKDGSDMFANGVLSASRIEDYQAGPVGSQPTDSKNQVYVLTSSDAAFGASWQAWKDAVANGADFYDGDGDGVYNPVDKNNNGVWDANEDRPDLLGDATAWTVYNDGVEKAQRRFTDVDPKGIEIRQTVFGFKSKGIIGNMLFVRYRIVYKGLGASSAAKLDSCYFSAAVDPDLGDYADDLVGCDTRLSAGYVYNAGPDGKFGGNCPTFMMDFFQGPIVSIPGETFTDNNGNGIFDAGDVSLAYATNSRGRVLGKDSIPGYKNLGLSSFTQYMQSHPTHGDPNTRFELRNYLEGGKGKLGDPVNPCTWTFGTVKAPSLCGATNPKYMYAGDPVADTGWINTTGIDQRFMQNTGPFVLEKNKPQDIVVAYILGRDDNASIRSVNMAKKYDILAQTVFDNNFPSVPPPTPVNVTVKTGENFIDLTWPTADQAKYRGIDSVMSIDRRFQGYYVSAYKTNSKQTSVGGVVNAAELTQYEMDNFIKGFYQKKADSSIVLMRPEAPTANKLDSATFANPSLGRIRYRISADPFTGGPLIKGKKYYFVVTTYTINHFNDSKKPNLVNRATQKYGDAGDYIDYANGALDEYDTKLMEVTFGEDLYAPASLGSTANKDAGTSNGDVKFIVADNSQLTGNKYQVEFFKDSASTVFSNFWRLKNVTTGTTLIDSSKAFNYNLTDYSGKVTDGFLVKVKSVEPKRENAAGLSYLPNTTPKWYNTFAGGNGTGVQYLGADLPASEVQTNTIVTANSSVTYDRARKIEVRFGASNFGKAYRYLQTFKTTLADRKKAFYATQITAADTGGTKGGCGLLGEGFVDVPFQVWVKDTVYGEEKQLACAFIERSRYNTADSLAKADGIWDPGTKLLANGEIILAFDAPYDPTGKQSIYTGVYKSATTGLDTTLRSEITQGYAVTSAVVADAATIKAARAPYFNALYVIGFERRVKDTFFVAGDKLIAPLAVYPYTPADKFSFTTLAKGALSSDAQKDLFQKVNVFPNPLFAYNAATSIDPNVYPDDPFVTFSNLPDDVTIKIYSLSGQLVRTLHKTATSRYSATSPFLDWNLLNQEGLRVASGMYMAIVTSPKYGEKILKFGIIMPQKQLPRY